MIEINNVSKYYDGQKVLDSVSLNIKRGEIFGLVGHSGAGKSTLLRTINALEDFDEGEIFVDNESIKVISRKNLRKLRRDVGMIFQHFALLTRKNVFENIALPLECWGYSKQEIKKRVLELLNVVGLESKRESYPSSLSGGQKQRVAIARSLALKPKIILSDESTSALDPLTTLSILDLLAKINQEFNVSIVLVTHEMEVVKRICHSAAFLEAGKVLYCGNIEEVFLSPNEHVKIFLGESHNYKQKGIGVKIYFPKAISQEAILTQMSQHIQVDFSIIGGKLEYFGNDIMGFLVIDVEQSYLDAVLEYLTKRKTRWEVLYV